MTFFYSFARFRNKLYGATLFKIYIAYNVRRLAWDKRTLNYSEKKSTSLVEIIQSIIESIRV